MEILQYIVGSIILILAVVLIVCISKQQGKRKGLENVISGQTSSNSYLNRTEAAKKGKRFEKVTLYVAILFGILVIALYTITAIADNMERTRLEESKQAALSQATSASTGSKPSISATTSTTSTAASEAESEVEESVESAESAESTVTEESTVSEEE